MWQGGKLHVAFTWHSSAKLHTMAGLLKAKVKEHV
jgi:hypothetical protein